MRVCVCVCVCVCVYVCACVCVMYIHTHTHLWIAVQTRRLGGHLQGGSHAPILCLMRGSSNHARRCPENEVAFKNPQKSVH
jgi:hypothetical protein